MLFGGHRGGKPLHPETASALPIYKIKTWGTFKIEAYLEDIEFNDFQPTTRCNARQRIFERNPHAADYIPMHMLNGVKFNNVDKEGKSLLRRRSFQFSC